MAKLPNIIETERSLWVTTKFVFRESLKGSKKNSIWRIVTTILGTAIGFVQFGALAIIVNEFATHGITNARVSVLVWSFIMLALSSIVPSLISSANEYFSQIQGDDLQRHMQAMQFLKMNELDIGTIEQPEFQNIYQVSNNRGWQSFFGINNLINSSIRNGVTVVISSISLIIISPIAFLAISLSCVPTYFLERKNGQLSAKMWSDNSEKYRIWSSKTAPINNKDALVELKNFNIVEIFLKKFLTAIGEFHTSFKSVYSKQLKHDIWVQISLTLGFAVAFAVLISGVYSGLIALGSLVFSFTAVSRFQTALNQLFDNFGRASEHRHNVSILMDFYEMKPMIVSGSKTLNQKDNIVIRLENVSFAYPGTDRMILNKISLSISQGDNIAIVGLNGAGKTTLIKLLTRVYDPTEGEILINGIPLKEYDLESWKSKLAILLQEYSIYAEETVEENIMLGNSLKRNKLLTKKSAAEATIAKTISALPNKYEQRVGTEFRGGVEFSKGQKQKLALARTLYRSAPIMILDEPTASIDAVSEDTIFKNLKSNHTNQTRVIISHKFSNVRDADQIILIKDGQIFEQGSHDQLIEKDGEYKRLFEIQAEGYR